MIAGTVMKLLNWKHQGNGVTMEFEAGKGYVTLALMIKMEAKAKGKFDLDAAMKKAGWVRAK